MAPIRSRAANRTSRGTTITTIGSYHIYVVDARRGRCERRAALPASAKSADHVALGAALRELRLEQGLSQEQVGLEAGLHRNYVGGCERGEVNVGFANLLLLTRALEVPLSELVRRYERELTK